MAKLKPMSELQTRVLEIVVHREEVSAVELASAVGGASPFTIMSAMRRHERDGLVERYRRFGWGAVCWRRRAR